ncbi:MAG TPA: cytochrome c-type biogenesis protein CcmH, partial [Polyangiales bacterium]
GGLMLLAGAFIAISPSVKELLESVRGAQPRRNLVPRPALATLLLLILAALMLVGGSALAQDSSSLMAGNVAMNGPEEKALFDKVLCQCGGCARLPLSSCVCEWAESKRAQLRTDLAGGKTVPEIVEDYGKQYGPKGLALPPDKGFDRALWAVPISGFVVAAGGLAWLGRRWVKRNTEARTQEAGDAAQVANDDALDKELDAELRKRDEA